MGAFPVEWRVPAEQVEAERAWTEHFARYYYRGDAPDRSAAYDHPYRESTVSNWVWLGPWIKSLIDEQRTRWQITFPALFTVMVLSGRLFLCNRCEPKREFSSAGWLLLIPTLSGMIFWFVTAPRPGFGFFLFWILAALCAGQIVSKCIRSARHQILTVLPIVSLLIGALPAGFHLTLKSAEYAQQGDHPLLDFFKGLLTKPGSDLWLHPMPTANLQTFTTESGLQLYVPEEDNRCFNAPLPCTPHPAHNLRLRRAESLGFGFVVDGQWCPLRWPNPSTDFLSSWRDYRSSIASPVACDGR
jgi:hypothetical protein